MTKWDNGLPPYDVRHYCGVCHQWVWDIGPWCGLYTTTSFCEPLRQLRKRCQQADSEGDGPLVNGICWYIRSRTNDERLVP